MRRTLLVLLVPLLLAGCRAPQPAPPAQPGVAAPTTELTVFAAASLGNVLTKLGEAFAKTNNGVRINANLAGTQMLKAQLEAGARGDVFLSADMSYPEALHRKGLVGTPVVFASNHLTLAATRKNEKVRTLAEATRPGVRLVACAAAVPAGKCFDQALAGLRSHGRAEVADALAARLVSREPDVRSAMGKVTLGEADAGFVYRTDAIAGKLRDVPLPGEMRVKTQDVATVIKASAHPQLAAAFVAFLAKSEAKQILKDAGFTVAGKE